MWCLTLASRSRRAIILNKPRIFLIMAPWALKCDYNNYELMVCESFASVKFGQFDQGQMGVIIISLIIDPRGVQFDL